MACFFLHMLLHLSFFLVCSCEGLVIKTLSVDAAYEPGKAKWVKLKKDYLERYGE